MENNTDCYITLSSKAQSVFFPNKCNNFKVKLKQEIDLSNGNWKVALTKIFVCCNIVEYNLVGDTSAQLLTSVPIEGKHGNTLTYSPLLPEFKNVSENIISDIEIQLKNGKGELINFKPGRVDITLHFKRVDI